MSPQSESPKSPDSASESSEGPATPSQAPSPATPQATQLVSTGRHFDRPVATVNLPLTRASSVLFETLALAEAEGTAAMAGEVHRTTYATSGTPTTMALMDALAEIEGAPHRCRAAIMPSGLAAISVALLAYCKPGDHVLMSDSVYGPARTFATTLLERYGVVTEFFDPHIGAGIDALITPQTRVVYLESPGSYTFEIQDVPAICRVARARGVISMIDNAWASPVMARPFDWGVDVSLLPLTKYWGGQARAAGRTVRTTSPLQDRLFMGWLRESDHAGQDQRTAHRASLDRRAAGAAALRARRRAGSDQGPRAGACCHGGCGLRSKTT